MSLTEGASLNEQPSSYPLSRQLLLDYLTSAARVRRPFLLHSWRRCHQRRSKRRFCQPSGLRDVLYHRPWLYVCQIRLPSRFRLSCPIP